MAGPASCLPACLWILALDVLLHLDTTWMNLECPNEGSIWLLAAVNCLLATTLNITIVVVYPICGPWWTTAQGAVILQAGRIQPAPWIHWDMSFSNTPLLLQEGNRLLRRRFQHDSQQPASNTTSCCQAISQCFLGLIAMSFCVPE